MINRTETVVRLFMYTERLDWQKAGRCISILARRVVKILGSTEVWRRLVVGWYNKSYYLGESGLPRVYTYLVLWTLLRFIQRNISRDTGGKKRFDVFTIVPSVPTFDFVDTSLLIKEIFLYTDRIQSCNEFCETRVHGSMEFPWGITNINRYSGET